MLLRTSVFAIFALVGLLGVAIGPAHAQCTGGCATNGAAATSSPWEVSRGPSLAKPTASTTPGRRWDPVSCPL